MMRQSALTASPLDIITTAEEEGHATCLGSAALGWSINHWLQRFNRRLCRWGIGKYSSTDGPWAYSC